MPKKKEPSRTPKARLDYLVNLAFNEAEKRLLDGTASSQIITTLLSYGTEREQLKNDQIRSQLKVNDAKIESIQNVEEIKNLMSNAIKAMKSYQGIPDEGESDDYDDY
jgi:hypothetical protein